MDVSKMSNNDLMLRACADAIEKEKLCIECEFQQESVLDLILMIIRGESDEAILKKIHHVRMDLSGHDITHNAFESYLQDRGL